MRIIPCQVPGCGPIGGEASPFARACRVCDDHISAESVPLDSSRNGELVLGRFCNACGALHRIDAFEGGQDICRPMAAKACRTWWGSAGCRNHRRSCKGGHVAFAEKVWGQPLMDCLTGKSVPSRFGFPFVYSCAAAVMDHHDPQAWLAILGMALVVHFVVPLLHFHAYFNPLQDCRRAAAKYRLKVAPDLSLVHPIQQKTYEELTVHRTSLGNAGDALVVTALLLAFCSVFSHTLCRLYGAPFWWTLALPLLVGAAVFVPLRLRAVARGRRTAKQWVDTAIELYCLSMMAAPFSADWLFGWHSCALPQSFIAVPNPWLKILNPVLFHLAVAVARAFLTDKPLPWLAPYECLHFSVFAVTTYSLLVCYDRLTGEPHTPAQAFGFVAFNPFLSSILYVALKARREASNLQAFFNAKATAVLQSASRREGHGRVRAMLLSNYVEMSGKLEHGTPVDLPADLRDQAVSMVQGEQDSVA
mmetsp:Transcript_28290/g.79854  ORF Transcript_28290/g.79854 Transcript_28290/m.79854 type:complete len:475 (+) Transcript_28290:233-1657(+)